MCVRYVLRHGDLFDWIERVERRRGRNSKRNFVRMVEPGESFPGDSGLIALLRGGELSVEKAAWGLVPPWTNDPDFGRRNAYNARSETLLEKPTFREPIRKRRCLIPASGFFERSEGRWLKFGPAPSESPILLLAGLYEEPSRVCPEVSYSMVTSEPNALVAQVHDRMPVILNEEAQDLWLDPGTEIEDILGLLAPSLSESLAMEDAGPIRNRKNEQTESLFED